MAKAKRAKKRAVEIVDYIAVVDRTALSYGRSHHHLKWEKVRPNGRALHLAFADPDALTRDIGRTEDLDDAGMRGRARERAGAGQRAARRAVRGRGEEDEEESEEEREEGEGNFEMHVGLLGEQLRCYGISAQACKLSR